MFGLFKKKEKEETPVEPVVIEPLFTLHAVANGQVIPIEQVNDPVFSQKFMGDGFAVMPTDGIITSPVTGEIMNVFPTQHAVGIKTPNGVEVLLHMGLDTVELKGEPFKTIVKEGDQVTPETLISTVDLQAITDAGKDTAMVVVLTNMDKVKSFEVTEGTAVGKDQIGSVEAQ